MDEWTAPNQVGLAGYEGYLNNRVATLPQLLKGAGYHTYMVGKWHLGKQPDQIPAARGFERDFSLLDGAGSYWDMTNFTAASPQSVFTEDGKYLTELPKDYYATKTYTDKLIGFIDANRGDGKPFFAYVAHQAPHDPYHLPRDWRNRHVGEYDKGWDAVRQERLKRQVELGIVPAGTPLAERMWFLPDPTLLAPATRAILGKKMELYAGMVENFDYHVGRLIDHLKQIGEYENTVFVVFGDNGAEGTDLFAMIAGTPGTRDYLFAASKWSQNNPNAWGDPGLVRRLRADVGAGLDDAVQPVQGLARRGRHPQRAHRQRSGRQAGQGQRQRRRDARGRHHADAARDRRRQLSEDPRGQRVAGAHGQVLGPGAGRDRRNRRERIRMPSRGSSSAIARCGRATGSCGGSTSRYGTGDWELFNLATDPAERTDLAAEQPDKVRALVAVWDAYVATNNVVLPSRSVFETLEDQLPPRVPVDAGYPAADQQAAIHAAEGHDGETERRAVIMGRSLRPCIIAALLAAGTLCPLPALAQTPARFYWKTLSDANAVPVIVNSISGNTNPFDPAHSVVSARRAGGRDDGARGLGAHLHAGRPLGAWRGHRADGPPLGLGHRGRPDGHAVGQRVRRPDAGVQPQPHRPQGAADHS